MYAEEVNRQQQRGTIVELADCILTKNLNKGAEFSCLTIGACDACW